MGYSFEAGFVQWLRSSPKGPHHSLARGLLLVASWIYSQIVRFRSKLYHRGWLRSEKLSIPVISVGNIVAGGGGKTPAILLLCDTLKDRKLAIASRGYRSAAEKSSAPILLSQGQGPLQTASQCGDEPVLIAKKVPDAIVCVGPNRFASGQLAQKNGAELLLLDDGFQHRQLARDFDIVVIDATEPFGLGHFLPRGFLRESPEALQRADLIVVTQSPSPEQRESLVRRIRPYSDAPIVWAQLEVKTVRSVDGTEIPSLHGKPVGIFSGIAKPQSFRRTVESLGARIVDELRCGDHQTPPEEDFQQFEKQCLANGAQYLLCTEKDSVRDLPASTNIPLAAVETHLVILHGNEHWEQMKIKFRGTPQVRNKYTETIL